MRWKSGLLSLDVISSGGPKIFVRLGRTWLRKSKSKDLIKNNVRLKITRKSKDSKMGKS